MKKKILSEENQIKKFLEKIDILILDCDGVLWCGDKILPLTTETLKYLKLNKKRIFFFTNNSLKNRNQYFEKICKKLNFYDLKIEDIFCTSFASFLFLEEWVKDSKNNFDVEKNFVYCLGSEGFVNEIKKIEIGGKKINVLGLEDNVIGNDLDHKKLFLSLNFQILNNVKKKLIIKKKKIKKN
jgi:ribonucleotide monophosphatase NagD (HAD superfamily)